MVLSYLYLLSPRILPEKLSVGVQPASQNYEPVYDQNLQFPYPIYDLTKNSTSYLWPELQSIQSANWAIPIYEQNGQNLTIIALFMTKTA